MNEAENAHAHYDNGKVQVMYVETYPNEGPCWPCGCLVGSPYCRCGADDPGADDRAEDLADLADLAE